MYEHAHTDRGCWLKQARCTSLFCQTERPRLATTGFTLVARSPTLALYDAHLITGRTHQLRIHFADAACAVVADPYYNEEYIRVRHGMDGDWCRDWKHVLSACHMCYQHAVSMYSMFILTRPLCHVMACHV